MSLATLAWRGLLARPLRSALAVVGIALGVAMLAAVMITGSASDQALRAATADLLGSADVRLRAFADAGFGPRTLQSLRSEPGVVTAAPVSERRLIISTLPGANERVFNLLVLGVDPLVDPLVRRPNLVAGVPLSADSPTDALVAASWAASNGLGLGDGLLLDGRRPGVPALRIVGLMADTGFGALERGEVLVAGREALDAAFESPLPIRAIDLDLGTDPTRADIDAVTATLGDPFVVETADDIAARFASARDDFIGVALLLGLVALVAGAFLAGNTLAMTVGERMRELGLLRAVGTTSGQVLGIVLRQAVALGVAGSVIGVVAGIGLAAAMIAFLSSTRTVLLSGLPLPIGGLLACGAVGLLVTFVAAVIPARRAAGITPLDALRPARSGTRRGLADSLRPVVVAELIVMLVGIGLVWLNGSGTPIVPALLSLGLLTGGAVGAAFLLEPLGRVVGRPFEWFFGAEGLLGRLNLSRDRARTGLTVGAMMIGLAAAVALGTVAESARAETQRRVDSILPGGHAIRTSVPLDVESYRADLQATEGVSTASPVLELPIVRVTDAAPEEAMLAGIDPNVFADNGALLIRGGDRSAAFAALRAGGAVLLPEPMAARIGIGVGQPITLALPGGDPRELTVAGLVEYSIPGRTLDGALLVSSADARDLFGATSASLWIMVPQPDIPDSAVSASVREAAVRLSGQALTAHDLAGEVAGSLDRLGGLLDALALIVVVIGSLGIVNTLGVGIGERVREIAILRSAGMTVSQVQAMVVAEAAIMGAIAGLLAVVVGLLVAVALLSGASVSAVRLPWAMLLAVVLAGTGIAALAGLYPARVAASLPIVRHLRQFE